MLHSASQVVGPAQRPRILKVHGAAIASSSSGVSQGEGMVIAMGTIAAAFAVAEWDWTSSTCQHHREPPKDTGERQGINNFLPRNGG